MTQGRKSQRIKIHRLAYRLSVDFLIHILVSYMTQGWKSLRIKIHRLRSLNPYPGELHDPGMEITKNKNP
jgi:hypothetical protein